MGDMIRDLFVRLGVRVDPKTPQALKDLDAKIEQVKGQLEDVAGWAIRAGVGLATFAVGTATAMGGLALSTGQHATEVERQARALNLSRKEYQEWLAVVERFGGNQRDLSDSFLQINEASQRAIDGSKEMRATFKSIGVEVAQLKGKNPGQLFDLLADRIAATADKGKALSAVSRLLGEESARKLGPALMDGSAALRAMRIEAEELGLVMSDDQLSAAKEVGTQWRRLTSIARGLRNELGAALAPMVTRVLRGTVDWVKANRELLSQRITYWVEMLRASIDALNAAVRLIGGWDVVFAAVAGGAGLLLLLANFTKIEATIKALDVAFGLLKATAMAAGVAIGAPFIPVAIIITGLLGAVLLLGLAVDDVVTHFRGGSSVLGGWLEIIDSAIPAFGVWRDMWWAIAVAVMTGIGEIGRFGKALVQGLAPALQLVNMVLAPLLAGMEALLGLWMRLNALAASPMQWATSQLTSLTAASDNNSSVVADQLRRNVAGSVQSAVNGLRMAPTNGATTNMSQTQSLTFNGSAMSQRDIEQALASSNRKAFPAVQGGVR